MSLLYYLMHHSVRWQLQCCSCALPYNGFPGFGNKNCLATCCTKLVKWYQRDDPSREMQRLHSRRESQARQGCPKLPHAQQAKVTGEKRNFRTCKAVSAFDLFRKTDWHNRNIASETSMEQYTAEQKLFQQMTEFQ